LFDEEVKVYKMIQAQLKPELKKLGMKNMSKLDDFRVQLLRLQQVSNGLETLTGQKISSKEEALKELLESICTSDNKVIIFTWSKRMAKILKRDFAKYSPLLIVGGMTDEEKKENENKFNTNQENKLMIMTDAGARGLNLQKKSKTVIHYDLPWSIDVRTQREDRVHRHGQEGTVMIYELITKSDDVDVTMDEYKIQVLHRKQENSDKLMGDAKKVRKVRMSTKDIEKLLN
jgi:SNF2 family DNA or RNA helicase